MLEKDFKETIVNIKNEIINTQTQILSDANSRLINLYFKLGKIINDNSKWGDKFIETLELELKLDFPNVKGFSARNLRRMKRFYLEYKDEEKLPPAVAKLPWTHNVMLLEKIKDKNIRFWYANEAANNNWSKVVLGHQIDMKLYERKILTDKNNNFKNTLVEPQSDLANDVHFSYIDLDTIEEKFVSVPECGGGKLILEGMLKAGHTYYVGRGNSGMIGVYKIEVKYPSGHGKFSISGVGFDRETKEALNAAYNYFKVNKKSISASIQVDNVDYLLHIEDLQGNGPSKDISLASFVAMCSNVLKKPMQGSLVILGSMSIGGTIGKVEELANTLQVCFDSGAKKILLPMSSVGDILSVPSDLFLKFNISFYQDPEDAVYKVLGIE